MNVKIFAMDVDGTLTDGKIYIGDNNEAYKAFSIKDGYGIHDILISEGIVPVIITGRKSKIVEKRCEELGITEIHQGVKNKAEKLIEIAKRLSVGYEEVAYCGDDLNDMPCMKIVKEAGGMVGCPADAVKEVRDFVDFVAESRGGEGAVRSMIDFLTRKN
jgi:3-deoxy-D-manno-octulosonate 8-phosphate phosphatase (KDO 8-P phosphatase)